ncbi:MAG: Bug family tripartite tricarboxylate transporter substrate binding protein [Burkholderiales bacterium]
MKTPMSYRNASLSLLCASALIAAALPAAAQQFPAKPVRAVTPFPASAGPEIVLRLVADKVAKTWGQPLVVENRPGGNGAIAIEAVKASPADGYTLVQMDDAHMSVQPHLYKKLSYSPQKDFEPVATLFRTYFFVVVPIDSPWKNMTDLIAAAKEKRGAMSHGSWSIGSPGHIGMALFEGATGTQFNHVPFKEMSQLYTSVASNDVNWAFGTAASTGPMFRANKVRYLAAASPQRISIFPNVPTMAEAGGPSNFAVTGWVALFAPRGTPRTAVMRMNADVAKALAEPDVRERLATFTFEPFSWTPEEISKQMEADLKRYGEVIARAKISVE